MKATIKRPVPGSNLKRGEEVEVQGPNDWLIAGGYAKLIKENGGEDTSKPTRPANNTSKANNGTGS